MTVIIDGTAGITFPVTAGSASAVQASSGRVLQVVSASKTSAFTTTSTSPTDVTGMSVSITPTSTNSKILIIFYVGVVGNATAGQASQLWLLRDSTQISVGDTAGSRTRVSAAQGNGSVNYAFSAIAISFLDSPATTSSTTYKIQLSTQSDGGTACFNQRGDDGNSAVYQRSGASITVMEVAA